MRCESVLKQMDGYRTGELAPRLRALIEAHLESCSGCEAERIRLQRLAQGMSRLLVPAPRNLVHNVMRETMDRFGPVETDLGKIWVGYSVRGIAMILPVTSGADAFAEAYLGRRSRDAQQSDVPERYARLVQKAVAGEACGNLPLDLDGLTPFERKVLTGLLAIPRGEVRPYFWLAREVGKPKAARAVGTAMARNPLPFLLPCHRVVPAAGGVGNYAFGSDMKRGLLAREGVPIEDLDALSRSGVHYVGCKTTGIYCFPTCRDARRIRPRNQQLFHSPIQAADSGYRPCRRCRP